ncbi:sterigmatocystin biosynthesis monooxygenase stcw [Colletotrichum incanum]|uniref:Sterigmatocystin biosynthesis monooxygenase stcw n=1 Tax=Colletotrichum incanum TaxID=1573173 RepID=A0A161Y4Y2_COLIC|nr:sterigmatocystin biosynthesis monooxygenase stcw [Colletotrichum incanum]
MREIPVARPEISENLIPDFPNVLWRAMLISDLEHEFDDILCAIGFFSSLVRPIQRQHWLTPLDGATMSLCEQLYSKVHTRRLQKHGYEKMVRLSRFSSRRAPTLTEQCTPFVHMTGNCKSWYKNGTTGRAKITTLWPGSYLHGFTALRHPR